MRTDAGASCNWKTTKGFKQGSDMKYMFKSPLSFVTTWMGLEDIKLNEVSQTKKNTA